MHPFPLLSIFSNISYTNSLLFYICITFLKPLIINIIPSINSSLLKIPSPFLSSIVNVSNKLSFSSYVDT